MRRVTAPVRPAICVLAPGGIGAPIGGLLTKAGHDVALIDPWVEHVEAMKQNGLRITIGTTQAPEGEVVVPVRAYHLYEVAALRPTFDIVFLTCKSYDTDWLTEFIRPYLATDAVVVSVQNSINEERIAPVIGDARVAGCVLTGGGELLGPGHVWRNRSMQHHYYTIGTLGGWLSPEVEDVVGVLRDAGRTTTTTNLLGAKWSKLVLNSMGSALSALAGKRTWQLIDNALFLSLCTRAAKEAMQVGAALGYETEPIFGLTAEEWAQAPDEMILDLIRGASSGASEGARNMIQQDIERGRQTEVGYLNGLVVRKGREAGVPTPVNEAILAVFPRLEHGELSPALENLDLVTPA